MAEFREYRKTATVEAIQVTEDNCEALADEFEDVTIQAHRPEVFGDDWTLKVETHEGPIRAPIYTNPYLCRGVEDEMCLVKADVFEASYEPMVEAFGPQEDDPEEMDDMMTVLLCFSEADFDSKERLQDVLQRRMMELAAAIGEKGREVGWLEET